MWVGLVILAAGVQAAGGLHQRIFICESSEILFSFIKNNYFYMITVSKEDVEVEMLLRQ